MNLSNLRLVRWEGLRNSNLVPCGLAAENEKEEFRDLVGTFVFKALILF